MTRARSLRRRLRRRRRLFATFAFVYLAAAMVPAAAVARWFAVPWWCGPAVLVALALPVITIARSSTWKDRS